MGWHAVAMLAWAGAARGADIGDAESARAARIELLKDENAKMVRTLEKVRGAISHWDSLSFVPGVGASSAEDEGLVAPAELAGAPSPGRRLETKVPGGVKVWQGGVLHNFKNAQSCPTAWSKCPPWRCPSSAPVPPQGAPGGPGQLGTPRAGPTTASPATAFGARASCPQSCRFHCVLPSRWWRPASRSSRR